MCRNGEDVGVCGPMCGVKPTQEYVWCVPRQNHVRSIFGEEKFVGK